MNFIIKRGPSYHRSKANRDELIHRWDWRGVTFYYGNVPLIEVRYFEKEWYVYSFMCPSLHKEAFTPHNPLKGPYFRLKDIRSDLLASLI